MTLEEKIRALAHKGELVHLSLAFRDGLFYANFAAASPPGGYARESDADPVFALEKAFASSPVKVRKAPSHRPTDPREVTAAVILTDGEHEITAALPADWTKP